MRSQAMTIRVKMNIELIESKTCRDKTQEKHAHKTANERWEYALSKIKK